MSWTEWTQRDDRSWLKELEHQKWQPEACLESLKPLLETIVTSLQYNDHSRWGVQISTLDLNKISEKFLTWMKEEHGWQELSKSWHSKDFVGTYSLPLFLSRYFIRFREIQEQKAAQKQKKHSIHNSYSAQRSMLELPSPGEMHRIAGELSGPILDAFSGLAHNVPEEHRLSFQLHLEGLLPQEISQLSGFPLSDVKRSITEAKRFIREHSMLKVGS